MVNDMSLTKAQKDIIDKIQSGYRLFYGKPPGMQGIFVVDHLAKDIMTSDKEYIIVNADVVDRLVAKGFLRMIKVDAPPEYREKFHHDTVLEFILTRTECET